MSSAASRTYVCVHCHGLVAPPGVPFAWAGDMCICALPKAAPPPAQHFPPCTVCGTPYEKHGSYPTCASHPYTVGHGQHSAVTVVAAADPDEEAGMRHYYNRDPIALRDLLRRLKGLA